MNYYFAPMEGITGHIYRRAHHEYFHHVDKYFSPFITTKPEKGLSSRELNDILPENNKGIILVPQMLSNCADDFIRTALELQNYGYKEVNLNLGCPSGTVVSKHKGSGFLALPGELEDFLNAIYGKLDMKISIKTRLGKEDPSEFYNLIKIFNKFPVSELIIHPRIQKDFYKNKPNLERFKEACLLSKNPVVYNGNICTGRDYQYFCEQFENVDRMMIGRGLLAYPGLLDKIEDELEMTKESLRKFHDKIYQEYQGLISGGKNVLFKMKELWFYLICIFENSEKYGKKIRKAQKLWEYEAAVEGLFRELRIREDAGFIDPNPSAKLM